MNKIAIVQCKNLETEPYLVASFLDSKSKVLLFLLCYLAIASKKIPKNRAIRAWIHRNAGFAESMGVWFGLGFSKIPEDKTKEKNQMETDRHPNAAKNVPNTLILGLE